ncbi:hypothetical protein ACFWPQ_48015 [Streptomyces sp. NPDC058464]|uniref:hypothetical protein n=1 Tax=Streptomyces sp. NPDC058464 TaxID=3346511 RepID=UPI00365DF8AA
MTEKANPAEGTEPARKWIAERIARLDPYKDYAEIWRLSTTYRSSEFQRHWMYAFNFPHFMITTWGAETVYREGNGKIIKRDERRVADTTGHTAIWSEHGPDSPVTRRSAEVVNKLHAHWAKKYPGAFSYADDYVYLFSFEACMMDGVVRSLGLPGYSENQKIAAHLFWSKLAALFTVEDGRPVPEAMALPESFEAMEEFRREYENRSWPDNPVGEAAVGAILDQFATRWFPRLLQPLGRTMITTFFSPGMRRVLGIPTPSPALDAAARTAMKARFLAARLQADPTVSGPDRRRLQATAQGSASGAVDVAVHRALHENARGLDFDVSCPHAPVPLRSRNGSAVEAVDQPL